MIIPSFQTKSCRERASEHNISSNMNKWNQSPTPLGLSRSFYFIYCFTKAPFTSHHSSFSNNQFAKWNKTSTFCLLTRLACLVSRFERTMWQVKSFIWLLNGIDLCRTIVRQEIFSIAFTCLFIEMFLVDLIRSLLSVDLHHMEYFRQKISLRRICFFFFSLSQSQSSKKRFSGALRKRNLKLLI